MPGHGNRGQDRTQEAKPVNSLDQGVADRQQVAGEPVMPLAIEIKVQGLQILLEDEVDELGFIAEVHQPILVLQWTAGNLPCPETLDHLAQAIHPLGRGGFRDVPQRLEADVGER